MTDRPLAHHLRRIALAAALFPPGPALPAADCNRNGIDDAGDVAAGTSGDCDHNGIPDECDTAPEIAFAIPRYTHLDSPPTALAAADLDGDGDVDLAAAIDGGLAILRGDGTGAFSPAGEVALGPAPGHVIASDLDGDGDLDLAVPSVFRSLDGRGFVTVLSNEGAASFRPAMDLAVGLGPAGLTAADLDGDGDVDLAAACQIPGGVSVLPGAGGGAFGASRWLEIGRRPISVAAADLDRDGKLDLVVGHQFIATITILIHGPDLAFERSDVALVSPAEDFTTLDLRGDGLPDLAVTQADGGLPQVLLLEGSGDGSFGDRTAIPLGETPAVLLAADLNGDGGQDLAAASRHAFTVTTLLPGADGKLAAAERYAAGGWTHDMAAADADLDGDVDLFSTEPGAGRIACFSNDGSGRFQGSRSILSAVAGMVISETTPDGRRRTLDFDRDGRADIAATSTTGIVVFASNTRASDELLFMDPSERGGPLIAADLDGDGLADLVAASARGGSGISLLVNAGGRSFFRGAELGAGVRIPSIAAGDLDGDGDVDLASVTAAGELWTWDNNGAASFPLRRTTQIGRGSSTVVAADLDGDGDLDLATADTLDSRVSIIENRGGGVLAPARWTLADRPRFLVPVDLDGDRRVDLVSGGLDTSSRVLWNAGGMAFEEPLPLEPGAAFSAADALDIDRDGDLDLALAGSRSATLFIVRNQRSRRLAGATVFSLPRPADLVSGEDLDGDGAPDIALAAFDGGVTVVRNRSQSPAVSDANENGIPDACEGSLFVRGDPDADGRASIADALLLLRHLFRGESLPACAASGDADADGALSATDAVVILGFLFRRGPVPAPPFPDCGIDPVPGSIGCEEYPPCAR